MAKVKKSEKELEQERYEQIMEIVAWRTAFYRANPQRFAKELLNVNLKPFQSILLYAMMHNYFFAYIASRSQGKTFLAALYAVIRCILYPGTKICVAASTKKQACEILNKINDEFLQKSPFLADEIEEIKPDPSRGYCKFKNGSWIKAVTSDDRSRGNRSNVLILDEFRMIDKNILDAVIRKFNGTPRQPDYVTKKEYAHLAERNSEIYLSSAWYCSHWSYEKLQGFFLGMIGECKKYFVCSLPYQLPIKEGLLIRESVEDDMAEPNFSELLFSMEMEALFFSDNNGSFFTWEDISKRRKLKTAFMPLNSYAINDKKRIPPLQKGEKRILSVDVALMPSKRNNNDTSALIINSAMPTGNGSYTSNIAYIETYEGLTTDELSIIVMRTFYEYHCTDLVLDTNGLGMGVFDFIIKNQYDSETGKTYPALSCCNDTIMASRCKVIGAEKKIWSIKATPAFNNEICILLRSGLQNGKINLLIDENEAETTIKNNIKNFNKLTLNEQIKIKLPYTQTSLMINELINLDHEVKGNVIRIIEKPGARKDRYSSLAYNYWVTCQLERKLRPKEQSTEQLLKNFIIRKAKIH